MDIDLINQHLAASYINQFYDWQQTFSLTFLNENFTLRGQDRENSVMLIPSAKWLITVSDNPIKPTHGYTLSLSIQGTHEILGSSNSFFQVHTNGKIIHPIFSRGSLLARATLGYTATKDLNQLPLSLQLLTGGAQSIRGYDYKSIGPGRFLAVASIEYRHRVIGNWYLASFYDVGSANRKFLGSIKRGPGAGIVWLSPIGAVEVTAARGMDSPGKPWLFQFSVGPDL